MGWSKSVTNVVAENAVRSVNTAKLKCSVAKNLIEHRAMKAASRVIFVVSVLSIGCQQAPESTVYPARPVKIIVPFSAGGGSDTFGRIIQKAIEDKNLLPQKLVMINVPGAGGTIGSRRVKNARPDGYTLLLLHEGIMTAKYSGQAAYGPEAFEPIAGSGDATQVIVVNDDSPFQDLRGLMTAAANDPDQIVFAANIGAPSQFAGLMLEREQENARFRYTPTGGGAKRFSALKGGHVDVSAFSIAEFIQFRTSGMRAIALLGDKRHPDVSDVATAREQGFDVLSRNMQFWWAPKGTNPEQTAVIAAAISQAMQSDDVRETLAQMRIDPRFVEGQELADEIEKRSARIAAVASRDLGKLPNFPRLALWATIVLGCLAIYPLRRARRRDDRQPSPKSVGTPVLILLLTVAYVVGLQFTAIGFRISTFAFVLATGWTIARGASDRTAVSSKFVLPLLGITALVLSVGVFHLFTQVLVVDLP